MASRPEPHISCVLVYTVAGMLSRIGRCPKAPGAVLLLSRSGGQWSGREAAILSSKMRQAWQRARGALGQGDGSERRIATDADADALKTGVGQTQSGSTDTIEDRLSKLADSLELLHEKSDRIGRAVRVLRPKARGPAVSFSRLPGAGLLCPVCLYPGIAWVSAYPSTTSRFRMATLLCCEECGSAFVPEGERFIDGYYEEEYARSNRRDRDLAPEAYFRSQDDRVLANYFARADAHISLLRDQGASLENLLDYGSGPGYLLFRAQPAHGFAVEPDIRSRKYLEFLNAEVLPADQLGDARFDAIVASHVIEHLTGKTLDTTLASIAAALKPGGHLLVEVPNGGHSYLSIVARHEPHTLFFSPEGLVTALRRAGLKILVAGARGLEDLPERENPIYAPPSDSDFGVQNRDQLFVIATR